MLDMFSIRMAEANAPGIQQNQHLLFLTVYQQAFFGLEAGDKADLYIGFDHIPVLIEECNFFIPPDTLLLSEAAYAQLTHYHGERLWLVCATAYKIVLGPTVGITIPTAALNNMSSNYPLNKRALLALEKGILVYFFHLRDIDFFHNRATAYYLNPLTRDWQNKSLPFPQVVYYRTAYSLGKKKSEQAAWKNYQLLLQEQTIVHINNALVFDKWEIYQVLTSNNKTVGMQPPTTLLHIKALEKFIDKYSFCYAKSSRGRCGKEVYRVEKREGNFLCSSGGSILRLEIFNSLDELYRFLKHKLGTKAILQEGIVLAELDGHPFDIRVLAQKDFHAQWVISALSFRVAEPNAVVTNISAGAKEIVLPLQDNPLDTGISASELCHFCLQVLGQLESHYGSLGEVGLDVGLDDTGRLWLIEANLKPSSKGYQEAATEELCNKIFGLPLDYAKYLARASF